ncbi:MAG: tetratricopeptide repeat protein, partial [Chthoniobacterales bacterium]
EFNFPASIREFERAIALNPNYATAHHWFGNSVLSMTGQFDRSIAEGKRAVELDPLSLIINADLAQDYGAARRWDEAIAQFRKTLEMDPRFYYARSGLGVGLQLTGDLPGALAEFKQAVALNDDPNLIALVAQAQAYLGHPEEARRLLQQLEEAAQTRYVSKYSFAIVHIALGENEKARAVD